METANGFNYDYASGAQGGPTPMLVAQARARAARLAEMQALKPQASPGANLPQRPEYQPQPQPEPMPQPQQPYDPLSSIQTQNQNVSNGMMGRANEQTEVQPAGEDYSQPAEEQWTATGKTDSFGSFFNKRQGTDALTAFGAAMLKAPNFREGLANGAIAVNLIDRENRMPTPEEIARANIKARIANGSFSAKPLQQGYDANGGNWTQILNAQGNVEWNGPNGVKTNAPPEGFIDRSNSGYSVASKNSANTLAKDQEAAVAAYDNLGRYSKMAALLDGGASGAGTGVYASISRGLATLTGTDFAGTDIEQMQQFEKMASTGELEAAISQKGLGQLTEGEREIIRRSVPTITTNPESAKAILKAFASRERRIIEMQDEWEAADLAPNKYNAWKLKYMREWDKTHASVYAGDDAKAAEPQKKSIIDEADAIVSGN